MSLSKMVQEPSDHYHAHVGISASKIRAVLRSPAHFKSECIDGVKKDTPAKRFGTLAHTALLEPKFFLDNYIVQPKFEGTGSRKAKQDWLDGLDSMAIVMKEEEAEIIVGMIMGVQQHKVAAALLKKGIAEHSGYFVDEKTGLPCKFRPDYLTEDGYIIDIKSTTNASREAFSRQIGTLGYHISAAHYLRGFKAVMGYEAKGYIYIPIEKAPPYVAAVYVADATIIEKGDIACRRGLDTLKVCMDTDTWPGYQTEAENISLPHWMLYEENEEAVE